MYPVAHIPARSQTTVELTVAVRAVWSRFASPRAEIAISPSQLRPNLFSGD